VDDAVLKAAFEAAWFQRFLELFKALSAAAQQVVEASGKANADYRGAFAGVENDLRNACVRLGG
jgi:hypothetical protein